MTQWRGVLLAAFLYSLIPDARADGFEFWQEGDLKWPPGKTVGTAIGWKLAFDVGDTTPLGWEIKPGVKTSLRSGLDAAATYQLARDRGSAGDWESSHALELDLVPSWPIGDGSGELRFTQRLAIVQLFDDSPVGYRYHPIPKISWPATWLPAQSGAESSLEAVYELDTARFVETKFTPLQLNFETAGGQAWYIAYLLNHKRDAPGDSWERVHVIVFGLGLSLPDR